MATATKTPKKKSKLVVGKTETSKATVSFSIPSKAGTGSADQATLVSARRTGRKIRARQASKFGKAFEAFAESKGINLDRRQDEKKWTDLLDEFANRPIYGYRRGSGGGNHRRS